MPRLARLDAPGVLHHVMIRGIERRNIFDDNKDPDNLLTRLEELMYWMFWKRRAKGLNAAMR